MSSEKSVTQYWPVILLAVVLYGCSGEQQPQPAAETTRPVKTLVIADASGSGSGVRNFPARIDAAQQAELAFRVPGKVDQLLVKEGDVVQAEQTVARLDPKDFQIVVNDRQAIFDRDTKNYDRAKGLVKSGAISRMDFDRIEAEFKSARAALDSALQDLDYTDLKAPFSGIIAQRYIQQFEEVQAKQSIATLQDVETLEVKFDVPESVIRIIRPNESGMAGGERIQMEASFDDLPGQSFPLTFKEVATKADANTQTFQVTFSMDQVAQRTILPGMTATVTVDLSEFMDLSTTFAVPVSAVVGDFKLDPRVWVVDSESMTTRAQPVAVGRMTGDTIEVTEGLESGMRIVTAGASFVTEGMQVTLMPEREQAEPRASDAM